MNVSIQTGAIIKALALGFGGFFDPIAILVGSFSSLTRD